MVEITSRRSGDASGSQVTVAGGRTAGVKPAPANPGTVVLRLPTKSVTFPAVCAPALRAVLEGDPVSAGTLPGLDADDGLVVLRRLLREGVVVAL